ncbi:uncharacterized protein Z519_01496 [Cladophialophora bantiana CBS 173.52]|uniref:Uncharacterized protein n=1 Tax=Cladophialophora bantiana (strain ATCC 10958 / CBS 173.52 / CDC B-1940 / NIH 8579) TaxID=1442370 RepID=A0A0D2GHT3_CLAB1|nr:uncharacterized protein Z519_01496 [Cladophialophora bantiana CBS 173.52]KIW97912.1 hypothetical protein Z519_01496 [Cladophialophora bantiana CBS 173.52]
MATEIGDKTWEAFLHQHNSLLILLDSHASLLAEMRKFCVDSSATLDLVQTRLLTTESLIATFKLSTESLAEITKREEQNIKEDARAPEAQLPTVPMPATTAKSNAHLATEPLLDPSGLFTVDTNPTPIDQLYKEKPVTAVKAKDRPKRKASGQQPDSGIVSQNEPLPKRSKKGHEQEGLAPKEEDDSFLKRVEARSRAKEERKKARLDKKRKRQSGDSTGSAKGPKKKKQKERHEPKLATATTPVDQETRNGKRPHTEPNNDGTNGHSSKKKRRGSRH